MRKTRYYVKCLGYNGEEATLVCKAHDKQEAKKLIKSTYKIDAILEVSDKCIINENQRIPYNIGESFKSMSTSYYKRDRVTFYC